jgi:hypothetical protein
MSDALSEIAFWYGLGGVLFLSFVSTTPAMLGAFSAAWSDSPLACVIGFVMFVLDYLVFWPWKLRDAITGRHP